MVESDVPVLAWPASIALPAAASLCVISVVTPVGNDRRVARQVVRQALKEALGRLLQQSPESIELTSVPGAAPRLADQSIGLSVSHESGLSIAAINLHGPTGIDLMRVATPATFFNDWETLARDYLGPLTATSLAQCAVSERTRAFAMAWTAQEARLKCRGMPLTEWKTAPHAQLAFCDQRGLALPDGYVGTVCWSDRR